VRISESSIRSIIRKALLESYAGFISKMEKLENTGPQDPKYPKKMKKIWNEEDDESFMKSLIKIHWFAGGNSNSEVPGRIVKMINDPYRVEIASMAYRAPPFYSSWGDIGIAIKGNVTLASNINITSGNSPGLMKADKPRRYSRADYREKVLDAGSFRDLTATGPHNEFIVANWTPYAIVFSSLFRQYVESLSSIERNDEERISNVMQAVDDSKLHFLLQEDADLNQRIREGDIFNKMMRLKRARDPRSTESDLEALSRDPDEKVRIKVANNPTASWKGILDKMLESETVVTIRNTLAKRKDIPVDMLVLLARDESHVVRSTVASNPRLPQSVVLEMVNDTSETVRAIIADRDDLSDEIVRKLSRDPSSSVRIAVATREDISEDILIELSSDDEEDVSSVASSMLLFRK